MRKIISKCLNHLFEIKGPDLSLLERYTPIRFLLQVFHQWKLYTLFGGFRFGLDSMVGVRMLYVTDGTVSSKVGSVELFWMGSVILSGWLEGSGTSLTS